MATTTDGSGAPPPSETSPLLQSADEPISNGAIERNDNGEEESSIPIAKESSGAKLWLTLLSVWFGVFLGALGTGL